ncbi:mannose-1-phosphate guanylyltransferase [Deinococcus metalli]|uniref:Mannose-1-phosphate guanylyltransferase n=1 Tax=Deinococcus metalli TaxID=1141878 RepID=A0A7W8NPJ5_9DEIO|nr:sugar phosphate nucleotidyltransferase [Deinococcus metalli]MBB5375845.1 mannose-1-phosphate guanylyltransferase [Deinococcus metalli]GHF36612.1 nucleoside-diphosphate-sugar pyrophosphorylase [Deinococcus metalli]
MHAVIMAGGKGTRLRPYTTCVPKPLVPIGDRYSILEVVFHQLAHSGFTSVTLAIGHMGHLIRAFVGDGQRWGLTVDYLDEVTPLGTIGPMLGALDRLPEHFLVMNGDVLTNLDYGTLLRTHQASGAPVTVATYAREVRSEFGVLDVQGGTIVQFREKPVFDFMVSMGIYGFTRSTLQRYPAGQAFGFDQLILDLLSRGERPASYAFGGYWLDIGRPDDYDRANEEFEKYIDQLMPGLRGTAPGAQLPLPTRPGVQAAP